MKGQKLMIRLPTTILVATCLLAPLATAQATHTRGSSFGVLQHDSNQDGQLTRQEFTDSLAVQFGRIDPNGDGTSTPAERDNARQERRAERVAERFSELDKDNDGNISDTEFAARKEGRDGAPNRPRRARGGPRRMGESETITWAEFSTDRLGHFDRLDGNGDGTLSQAELHTANARPKP